MSTEITFTLGERAFRARATYKAAVAAEKACDQPLTALAETLSRGRWSLATLTAALHAFIQAAEPDTVGAEEIGQAVVGHAPEAVDALARCLHRILFGDRSEAA